MKNRVLLTLLIVFIVLAGVGITCGTIFVVREVEIVDVTVSTAKPLEEDEIKAIITQSGLQGKNILFGLNEDKIAADVKSVSRMIKLQSVTAEFPNKIVLTVSRRVPVYYDDKYYYDAEMCVVDAPPTVDCVNITGAGLKLVDGLDVGDLAVGTNEWTQCKIEQLKVIASYFDSLSGFKIAYDDTDKETGGFLICLKLEIKSGVTFKIKVKPGENFRHALEFTDQIYQNEANKTNGIYTTMYREKDNPNKVATGVYDANDKLLKDSNGEDMLYYEK